MKVPNRVVRTCGMTCVCLCAITQASPRVGGQAARLMVIEGGTLIDGSGGPPVPDAVIVVEGNRIKAVGPKASVTNPGAASKTIDARGKWILPGFIESHGHYREYVPELLINHGITTMIDLGNMMDYILAVREATASGKLWGPRVFACGSGIEGSAVDVPMRDRMHVHSQGEARAATEAHVRRQVDLIKVYAGVTPDELRGITDVAHKANLKVVGHLQVTDAREAAMAGIDGLIHGSGLSAALVPEGVRESVKATPSGGGLFHHQIDENKFDALIAVLVERKVMVQPDLVHSSKNEIVKHWDRFELEARRLFSNPELAYVPREDIERWTNVRPRPTKEFEERRIGYEKMTRFLKKFVDAGGVLLAGTDFIGSAAPGITFHQEMEVFVRDVGLTPMQAIQTGTRNVAEFYLKGKGLGTIAPGMLADIVILRGNPLQDIRNTRNIDMVMKDGEVMTLGYHAWYLNPYRMPLADPIPAPPAITSISPYVMTAGEKNLLLTVKGSGFVPHSVVRLAGQPLKTNYVSPTELTAEVPGVLLEGAGRLPVVVTHLTRRGTTEASFPWSVMVKYPN